MCGIAGIVDLSGAPVDLRSIERMTAVLAHRGPDDQGFFTERGVGLGHRRLAILDLSPAGRQPMASSDGNYQIVFNGEIYNFMELRSKLEARNHLFRTKTDTEVLLAGYQEWGHDLWARLDGFFAVGIWDSRNRRLQLVRDAFGIKPLFYAVRGSRIVFGSEIKALLASGEVPPEVDLQAVSDYLTYFYAPGPAAAIRGVRQIEAGEVLTFDQNGFRSARHWELAAVPEKMRMSEASVAELLREECRIAVRNSLVADVPIGLLLSGGLDSNIILHELLQLGHADIRAMTVGFREKSHDEADLARRSLQAANLSGKITYVEDHDVAKTFDRMVYHADALNANVANLPEYYIFRAASSEFKVALAGMGNDELFAGYSTYVADKLRPIYLRTVPAPLRRIIRGLAGRLPPSGRKYGLDWLARKFTEGVEYDALKSHFWWRTIFSSEEKIALIEKDFHSQVRLDAYLPYQNYYLQRNGASEADKILFADLQMFCINNANVLMDGLSMAFSVEVRPPFLSKRFVQFAFSVPHHMKLHGLQSKYILKKAYTGRLPSHVTQAAKTGLVAPLAQLLRGPLREFAQDAFTSVTKHPWLNTGQCRKLLAQHLAGTHNHALPIYVLLNYFRWHDQFIQKTNYVR